MNICIFIIVLELGMDSLAGDPLTHLQLTNNAYADVIERVRDFKLPILAISRRTRTV